jgi:hypothetical protein
MFSQKGVDASGTPIDYSEVEVWNNDWQENFTPNILFNAVTGEGFLGTFNDDGKIYKAFS